MAAHPLLDGLNPPQREAVQAMNGPLLILAGAGSGKTRVLTHRVAWMLDQGVDPRAILAVTFTNKAAAEMKHRVAQLVGARAERILVTTFHSACVRFLRQDIEALGWPRSFAIYDTDDQQRLVKAVMKEEGVVGKDWTPARLRGAIDQAKNRMAGPDALAQELRHDPGNPTVRVYRRYEQALKAAGAVDFNDLLNLVVKLWTEHPEVLARYQRRFQYLMVDEYQDTNRAQYELIRLLMRRPEGQPRNVAVVGDDDQSIYAFRGADIRNILDFERDFPDARIVRLEQNYRSTSRILATAHAVVSKNAGRMDKTLWTDKGDGEPVRLLTVPDDAAEAEAVVSELRALVRQGSYRWGDVAVIYRTNAASRPFEQVLVRAGVPHVLVGTAKFYERREVRDLLAYLKLVLNPADDMALERIINEPARGIGPKTVDAIRALSLEDGVPLLAATRRWAQGPGKVRQAAAGLCALLDRWAEDALRVSPGQLVAQIVEQSGYGPMLRAEASDEARGRLENLDALARAVEEPFDDAQLFDDLYTEQAAVDLDDPMVRLRAFVDRVSLQGQDEDLPDEGDLGKVTLLTAHLAKGLEFPVVYVVGLYEGGFPHFRALEQEADMEEERRLAYVAFTRAKERLVLTRARRRLVPGSGFRDVPPSPFLRLIPPGLLRQDSGPAGGWGGGGGPGPTGGPSPFQQRLAARQRPASTWQAPVGLSKAPAPSSASAPPSPPQRQASLFGASPLSASRPAPASPGAAPEEPDEPTSRTMRPEDPSLFSPGVEVVHPMYGRGTIQERQGSPANLKLVVHFKRHGRKTLMLNHANLEIVVS